MKRWKYIRTNWANVGYTGTYETYKNLIVNDIDTDGVLYYTDENGHEMQVLYPSTVPVSATTTSIVVTPSAVTLVTGTTQQLAVVDQDGNDVLANCTFVSATPAEATVSSGGLITAVSATSSVVITATHEDGAITDTCDVEVIGA